MVGRGVPGSWSVEVSFGGCWAKSGLYRLHEFRYSRTFRVAVQ